MGFRTIFSTAAIASALMACSDASGPGIGSVASLRIQSGDGQAAFAGAAVSQQIVIVPLDASGNKVSGQTATFTVTAGAGTIERSTAHAGSNGSITAPTWTLGRSAIPQTLEASVGGVTTTVSAVVRSDLKIDVRFFGASLTPTQQAIFTDAIARLRAVVVGALPIADVSGIGPAPCGVSELPAPTGTTDGIIIYAAATPLDGVNGFLGSAKLCYNRSVTDSRTVIGALILDIADVNAFPSDMRVVALHEMFHLLGFGYWEERHLLSGFNTSSVAYVGTSGIAGCRAVGGVKTCASAVPVQNTGGSGIANSHWRDAVFGEELMTASFKTKPVLSVMTIRSLEDLGYVVNPLAADPYTIPADNTVSSAPSLAPRVNWESQTPSW